MLVGDAQIMMFYWRHENVILKHSIKFITVIFLKHSFNVPSGKQKTFKFVLFLINFGVTSQGRPTYVLKRRLYSDVLGASLNVNLKYNTKHIIFVSIFDPTHLLLEIMRS